MLCFRDSGWKKAYPDEFPEKEGALARHRRGGSSKLSQFVPFCPHFSSCVPICPHSGPHHFGKHPYLRSTPVWQGLVISHRVAESMEFSRNDSANRGLFRRIALRDRDYLHHQLTALCFSIIPLTKEGDRILTPKKHPQK